MVHVPMIIFLLRLVIIINVHSQKSLRHLSLSERAATSHLLKDGQENLINSPYLPAQAYLHQSTARDSRLSTSGIMKEGII